MKTICAILCIFSAAYIFAQPTPPPQIALSNNMSGSAYACLTNPHTILGMQVTVNLRSAVPTTRVPNTEYVCFRCSTLTDEGMEGGEILLLVPQWQVSQFMKRYCQSRINKPAIPLRARLIITVWRDNSREFTLVYND